MCTIAEALYALFAQAMQMFGVTRADPYFPAFSEAYGRLGLEDKAVLAGRAGGECWRTGHGGLARRSLRQGRAPTRVVGCGRGPQARQCTACAHACLPRGPTSCLPVPRWHACLMVPPLRVVYIASKAPVAISAHGCCAHAGSVNSEAQFKQRQEKWKGPQNQKSECNTTVEHKHFAPRWPW